MRKGLSIDDVGEGVDGHRISGDTAGRALVLKPAILLKKSWGGYRKRLVRKHPDSNLRCLEIDNRIAISKTEKRIGGVIISNKKTVKPVLDWQAFIPRKSGKSHG